MQQTLRYKIYIRIYFFIVTTWETFKNFLNFIKVHKRKRAIVPDNLHGKTVIITGANSGIGKHTAKICAKLGAQVYILCRDLNRARIAVEEIQQELESEIKPMIFIEQLNLASLRSVRKCAQRLNERVDQIDLLINNAGLMMCPYSKTEDGIELQFATNHLGHFVLTNLLLDKIKKSSKARIINLSSVAHIPGEICFDNINLDGKYTVLRSYSQSKLANVLFTLELAKRLKGTNVTTFAVHPGLVNTNLARHLSNLSQTFLSFMHNLVLIPPELGAQTTLYCAFQPNIEEESGKYFENCQLVKKMLPHATDEDDAKQLWELSAILGQMENNNLLEETSSPKKILESK